VQRYDEEKHAEISVSVVMGFIRSIKRTIRIGIELGAPKMDWQKAVHGFLFYQHESD
jgi:hypothetical protein